MTHGYVSDKDALIKRLHRIEGQVRGIERMIEEERYCIDILTQIAAVSTALESLSVKLLEDHVTRNVERSITQQDLLRAARDSHASTLDWLRTARNLVKYAGADDSYGDVERYLKAHKLV